MSESAKNTQTEEYVKDIKKLLKLPIGIQDFEKLREGGYLYVDKTQYLVDIIDRGSVFFFSRPRRFGKSLSISTFDALFSGKKELFKGLYAEEFFNRPDYKISPVVRLDMSTMTTNRDVEALEASMLRLVRKNASRSGIEIPDCAPGDALAILLDSLAALHGRVVILVDEYDKPILDTLFDHERAEIFRVALRGFYTQIKASDESTRFVFMTGITKFTKTGVFSAMNNLNDISMDDRYAEMLGYTEDELLSYFSGHIAETAKKLGVPEDMLIKQIRAYYDGFSFDGVHRVYNPFSTLNFFDKATFKNFWFESGSPSFLVNYVKKHDIKAEDFRGKAEDEGFTSVTEIELAKPSSFLFQAGYLTVRERQGSLLVLDYPNEEVLSSMAYLFLYSKTGNTDVGVTRSYIERSFDEGRPEDLIPYFNQVLAAIPYDIYEREERKYSEAHSSIIMNNLAESFFHALLFTLIWAARLTTVAENHSYHGRSDIEIIKNNHHYVVELKIADNEPSCEMAADEAMAQIRQKGYADRFAPGEATLIGIAVDRQARLVKAHRMEKL